MSIACSEHRIIGCIGLALSGLLALISLTGLLTIETLLSYALLSVAVSLVILLLDSRLVALGYLGMFLAIILALKLLNSSILVGVLLILPIIQARYYKSFRPDIIVAGLGVVLALLSTITWNPLFLSATLIAYTTLAFIASRRIHTLSMAIAAIVPVVWGIAIGLMATLIVILLSVVAGSYIERVGCPFKRDSRLVFYGTLTSTAGILLAVIGSSLGTISYGLWILGLLLLASGLLVPRTPLSLKSS
ncbi:MAG: hypothetical protein QXO93_00375 [Acidilobaceae archaeon]